MEEIMIAKSTLLIMMSGITVCILGVDLLAGNVGAQPANNTTQPANNTTQIPRELVGTWTLLSATLVKVRGGEVTRTPYYGENPKGRLMFDEYGNYMLMVLRSNLTIKEARFKADDREKGTDEENRRVVHESIANYGTYWVMGDKILLEDMPVLRGKLVLDIEAATYPNWVVDPLGNRQKPQERPATITWYRLKYEVPRASAGEGTAEFIWKKKAPIIPFAH